MHQKALFLNLFKHLPTSSHFLPFTPFSCSSSFMHTWESMATASGVVHLRELWTSVSLWWTWYDVAWDTLFISDILFGSLSFYLIFGTNRVQLYFSPYSPRSGLPPSALALGCTRIFMYPTTVTGMIHLPIMGWYVEMSLDFVSIFYQHPAFYDFIPWMIEVEWMGGWLPRLLLSSDLI